MLLFLKSVSSIMPGLIQHIAHIAISVFAISAQRTDDDHVRIANSCTASI
jgi:hypothetical protein